MRNRAVVPGVVLSIVLSLAARADDGPRREVGAPPKTDVTDLYYSLSDLALQDQREQMWALSSKTKAALWTYNIERYLRHHPELSAEAREILREGIGLVNMPAWFEIVPGAFGYEQKTSTLDDFKRRLQTLPPQTVHEVFIRLGSEPESLSPVPEKPPASGSKSPQVPRVEKYACYCSAGGSASGPRPFTVTPPGANG